MTPASTSYRLRSAALAASVIDFAGSKERDIAQSYHYVTSGGEFPPDQLLLGLECLAQLGLVKNVNGVVEPAEELAVLYRQDETVVAEALLFRAAERGMVAGLDLDALAYDLVVDAQRREALLLALGRRFNDSWLVRLGAEGERAVMSALRGYLLDQGRPDLAERVRHVSLVSDQLGYDITAVRLDGSTQLVEVKTCGKPAAANFEFFLSRNEADVALRTAEWVLVACRAVGETVAIVGWCPGASLKPYLPSDGTRSVWCTALISVPPTLLVAGLPDL